MEQINYKVSVTCLTFNHAEYIKDALNGFSIQQTDFPFVCCIVDDYSTDGEQDILKTYLSEHFDLSAPSTRKEETEDYQLVFSRHKENKNCFFAVFFLKYNHYKKKAKRPYMKEWLSNTKFHALCEGDDYWTDPLKLQKQVDFLEAHPDYTMVCNRTKLYSEKEHRAIGENCCYNQSQTVSVKDAVCKGGLFISTCSIMYRSNLRDNYPDYCKKCMIGDYPLQIMAAMKGKIYYFNDMMSVYRVQNSMSWMGKLKWTQDTYDFRIATLRSINKMFKGFANDYPQYADIFKTKIAHHISSFIPKRGNDPDIRKKYMKEFEDDIKEFSFLWKIDAWIGSSNIPLLARIRKWYYSPFKSNIKRYK